jgi:hypothetical protein
VYLYSTSMDYVHHVPVRLHHLYTSPKCPEHDSRLIPSGIPPGPTNVGAKICAGLGLRHIHSKLQSLIQQPRIIDRVQSIATVHVYKLSLILLCYHDCYATHASSYVIQVAGAHKIPCSMKHHYILHSTPTCHPGPLHSPTTSPFCRLPYR